ncbi:hypothetical protein [Kordiimonas sp. SCSIO 12610]|uniref:hypothetical protein n=1 Tax=Kordiimonas sp. SCSIO 12610 TaxID=2829597 RepID=UPI002108D77D|nr:hypothetical protein [Kordiimonas sp. SCSIO 12610]UTW53956.1 hypothetical protein KFF44_08890 [Kordiimonas sp. SCSIO 12610]
MRTDTPTFEEIQAAQAVLARASAARNPVGDIRTIKVKSNTISRPKTMTHVELEDANTGRKLSKLEFEKAEKERALLERQTEVIADRLENIGIRARIGTHTLIGLLSEAHIEKSAYRNCNILPSVQSGNTHDMMKCVQYWLDTCSAKQTRMWVLSWGWVPLHEYNAEHKKFTRKISKMNSSITLQSAGISFVYSAIENTIKWKDGRPYLNLHAHVLVKATKKLGRQKWGRLIDDVKLFAPRNYLHDSAIRNAKEVVKYVFKPQEFQKLTDEQLGALFQATKGLRFHIPMGELKTFRSGLKADGLKLRKIESRGAGEWRLIKARERKETERETPPSTGDAGNLILGITSPSPVFNETFEPCLIVKDFTGTFEALLAANPWVEQRMAGLRATAERRNSIKDTLTTTVLCEGVEDYQNPPPETYSAHEHFDPYPEYVV